MPDPAHLTHRQQQWFASVRASLESSTGRTLAAWAELARACPQTAHRQRLAWMSQTHGLGQNYASLVLNAAFPPAQSWSAPDELAEALWGNPAARAICDQVRRAATALPDVITGQRRSFTAFSRRFQFAAMRPVKGLVRLGLALEPDEDASLTAPRREAWSERLHAVLVLATPEQVDGSARALLRAAWEAS